MEVGGEISNCTPLGLAETDHRDRRRNMIKEFPRDVAAPSPAMGKPRMLRGGEQVFPPTAIMNV